MAHFFEHQLDYIFFFYGLAFIILGAICVIIRRDTLTRLPWMWLGLFGFSHGTNEWLDMIALSVPDPAIFSYFRLVVMTLSFFFLIEFGRRGTAQLGGRQIGVWAYIPIGVCIAVGYFGGYASLNGSIRYSMGLSGGLWAAWALWRASSNLTFKNIFRYAALFIAIYAVATGLVVPRSSFLLAPFINHTSFFETTGLPIQLIRGILAILITTTFWYYYQSLRQLMLLKTEVPTTTAGREGGWISIALIFIILGGWGFTEYIGKHEERDMQNEVVKQATILAASLHPEHINALKGTAEDAKLIDYAHIKEQFIDTIDSSPHIRWIKLVLTRGNRYVFMTFDSNGVIERTNNNKPYADKLSKVFNNGEAFAIGPYNDKDGTFLSIFIPVYNHDKGSIIAALAVDVDAHEWKQKVAEHRIMPILLVLLVSVILISFFVIRQRLMESAQTIERDEKQLEEAQRIAHSGSWNWNIKTNEISWSDEVYHIFGLDPKLVSPDYTLFIDMVHPQDRESVKHAIYEAMYNSKPYSIEHRIVLPDGSIKVIYEQGETKYDPGKNPIQLIGTMQDITERKEFEEKLKNLSHKNELILASLGEGVYGVNLRGETTFINPAMLGMLGYSLEELIGKQIHTIIHHSKADGTVYPANECKVYAAYRDGVTNRINDEVFWRKDGTNFMVEYISTPIIENGKIAGAVVVFRNITEQKLYEQQLKEVNAAKDKFFSIVAHDLKNPFNALLGASEALNEGIDDFDKDEIKKLSAMVNKSAQSAYALLENLLEWSRSQLGRIKFEPQDINLKNIAAESLKAVESQAKNKEISLINNATTINVYADPNLLKTILRNLISNAIKYTNNGGNVTIGSIQTDDKIEISVTDTGIGMSPDAIEQIFRIDTKYSTPGTAKETGTGLGLILCKEFVEKHGGKIWVESEVDKGSTFKFTIPAKHAFNFVV